MKICVAQTKPIKANIDFNITQHKKTINLAVVNSAEYIFFPELSLTGYEPALAAELATTADDKRFYDFQKISNDKKISIAVGMPLKTHNGTRIGMIIFEPDLQRKIYCKQYLHADEYPYFIKGDEQVFLACQKIAIAICYEISVPAHIEQVHKNAATIYIASVAKSVAGMNKAIEQLAGIAKNYSMTVLMSNCVGHCNDFDCGGKSSAWNNKGELLGQLEENSEGLLIIDTISETAVVVTL